jgi:hypothetical protein
MDLDAEYKEYFQGLGDHGTAFYKFFDLFRINLGDAKEEGMSRGLHYGKQASDSSLSDEVLRALKTYLKTQRSWIRKQEKTADHVECRRRMWFWCQKLIEVGAFDRYIRRDICVWMDFAMERTMEGVQVRIESYKGNFVMAKDLTNTTTPSLEDSSSQA